MKKWLLLSVIFIWGCEDHIDIFELSGNNKVTETLTYQDPPPIPTETTPPPIEEEPTIPIPKEGLIAWYPFNGNANDESGNGNHGVIYNVDFTTDRFNKNNSSVEFDWDGISGNGLPWKRIELPHEFNLINNFTISSWVNLESYYYPGNDIHSSMIIGNSSVCYIPTNIRFGFSNKFLFGELNDNQKNYSTKSGELGEWHLVTMAVSSEEINLYYDGVLVSKSFNTTTPSYKGCLAIGIHNQGGKDSMWYYFDGKIDDLGIWDRTLNEKEILDLYNQYNYNNQEVR